MYTAGILEVAGTSTSRDQPSHAYARALPSAIPDPNRDSLARPLILPGEVAVAAESTSGCRFVSRCFEHKAQECHTVHPPLVDIGDGHLVACREYGSDRANFSKVDA